jgi:hypothetical protein
MTWSNRGVVNGYRYFTAVFDQENNLYHVPCIEMNKDIKVEDQDLYNHVNDDLKALYVAITRAKKTFVVFDPVNPKNRAPLDSVWRNLKVADFIDNAAIRDRYKGVFKKDEKEKYQQWVYKGFEYLRREQFHHAKTCFMNLNHQKCVNMCQAFIELEDLQKKEYYITMNQHIDTIDLQMTLNTGYASVAEHFYKAEKYQDAALCYFNCQNFSKARDNFERCGMKKEAAQMNYILGNYLAAADLFYEQGDYFSCLVCKEQRGDKTGFLEILVKLFQSDIKKEDKDKCHKLFFRYMKEYFHELEEKTQKEML